MSSTKSRMLKSIFWITIDKYSGLILSILVSMVLARLLSPSEFGLVALASVLLAFIGLLSNMGLGPAVIQEQNLTQKEINSIFTFTIIVGFVLACLYFCLSWLIAWFYKDSKLIHVCQLLSVTFFFGAINNIPSTLMTKNQRFKEMAICSISMNLITGPIAIFAAYKGLGVYSLMIAPFLNSVISFIYNRRFYPCNVDFHMSMAPIKRLASFSTYQMMFELVNYFSRNVDKLIIGRSMSIRDLGYYDKAYRLMQQPQNNITSVLNPVLQPNFAQYQNDMELMSTNYLRVIFVMASISFPLGVTLCLCGPEIIRLMYGSQWEPAIPCFQVLCLSLPFAMLSSTTGSIYQASNATKHLFFVGLINSTCMVLLFIFASWYYRTIVAVALAWTLFNGVGMLLTFSIMFRCVFHKSVVLVLKVLIKPAGNCFLLLVTLSIIHVYVELALIPSLMLKLSCAALLTLLYLRLTGSYDILSHLQSLRHQLRTYS